MGKKKRGHPDVEELLARPWCYYCERDFEDLKLLISHQKAKHFKCERCGKRLNTAGGLSVHMNQVHKENLTSVENALPNRQGLDIEIFGMEGVPEDIVQQHNQRIIQNFYTAQAERQAATGNPPRGQSGGQGPAKKIKMETPEELKKRLAEHRAKVAAQKAAAANGGTPGAAPIVDGPSPGQGASPFPPPQPGAFAYPGAPPYPGAAPPYPPAPAYPPGASPPPGAAGSAFNLPARPPGGSGGTTLPQRPPYYGAPSGFPGGGASTVDELVASAARQGGTGDDIDQLIRMAEAGIKPAPGAGKEEAPTGEKKGKKEMRMVYGDSEVSPEEKMAMLPRYRFVEEAAA
ncbi:BUB3-interacting and GLEBS motif-containing protein [Madurella fahalii]|uniref:BUB3-interacting and GLEBS motif-containing protein n=1 Tax=Madurella fahalii TaxID=1157608 RepID=A0ABQ0GJ11_9PEZI